jgi:hypothetical protein
MSGDLFAGVPKSTKVEIIGNLGVSRKGDVVTVRLNTYHQNQPYALFTVNELNTLIAVLKRYASR